LSVTGLERAAGVRYLPSWMEVTVSAGLVAIGFAAFALAVRHLPIFPRAPELDAEAGAVG
jgi:Ni/Fe-hydrogenase subunit HybB-like protein